MDTLAFVLRLLIAGILIASATPKLVAPLRFRQIVIQYALLPPRLAGPFSKALPVIELALGMLLLTGAAVRPVAVTSALLFVGFAGALMATGGRERRSDCGCFGQLARQGPGWLAAEDVALALAATFVAVFPGLSFRMYQIAGHGMGTHAALLVAVLLTLASSIWLGFIIRWKPGERGALLQRRNAPT